MKKETLLCAVAVLHALSSFGQEAVTPLNEDIIGPQPSTAQLAKFETPQPSLATGTVNFPVDLYTVRAGEVEIPVSLCYSTQGIKVYDDPYPCGYGWSLLPSMRVTRTILGRPDERYKRLDSARLQCIETDNDTLYYCVKDDDRYIPDSDCYDTQHDIFNVAIPGTRFTFILDKREGGYTALTAGKNGFIVEADSCLTRFTVTDPQGNLWQFGGGNTETAFQQSYATSWGLEKVRTYKGDSITVSWTKMSHAGQQTFAPGEYRDHDYVTAGGNRYSGPEDMAAVIISRTSDKCLHPSSIAFPGGTATFEYTSAPSRPMLSRFLVVSNDGDTLRHASFSYRGPGVDHRLLSRIGIEGLGDYIFTYDETDFSDFSTCYAADWWGYYNGKKRNLSTIPQITLKTKHNALSTQLHLETIGSAVRCVDADSMQANILRTVTLPSGGTVAFTYEPHRFPPQAVDTAWVLDPPQLTFGGGLRISQISVAAREGAEPVVTSYEYGDNGDGLAVCLAYPTPATFITARKGLALCDGTDYSGLQTSPRLTSCRTLEIHNVSQYMRSHIGETPIWYKMVTVYSGGGKTEHRFSDRIPANGVRCEWSASSPYRSYNDITCLRHAFSQGIVETSVTEYRGTGQGCYAPVKEVKNVYSVHESNSSPQIVDFSVSRAAVDRGVGMFSPDIREDRNGDIWIDDVHFAPNPLDLPRTYYECQQYPVLFITERLDTVMTKEYTSNGEITDMTVYGYSGEYDIVDNVKKYRNGRLYEEEARQFPFALGDEVSGSQEQALSSLAACNRITEPYSVTTYDASRSIRSRARTEYSVSHGLILPCRILQDYGGSRDFELKSFAYDGLHNVTDISYGNNSRRESFAWDLDGLYPVAGFAGISSNEARSLFGNAMGAGSSSSVQMWGMMAQGGGNAMFSTYSYRKLYGLASTTAFNGVTSSYGYDCCGRLTETRTGGETTSACEYAVGNGEGDTYIRSKSFTQGNADAFVYRLTHYDGLYRPVRSAEGNSGDGVSTVSLYEYDSHGRLSRQWNPAAVSGGGYMAEASLKDAAVAAYGNDSSPYTEFTYMEAPVDSVTLETGPGDNWHANSKSRHTLTSVNKESGPLMCRRYSISEDGLTASGIWPTGDLRVVTATDEDGKVTRTFTDCQGHVVLSRCGDGADTHYVYDSKGLLRYVIPPEASSRLERQVGQPSDIVSSLCYAYTYDDLNRCVSKKLPGCAPVYMGYDAGGRLCLTQDGNQRAARKWKVTLRDGLGRTAATALATVTDSDACNEIMFSAEYTADGDLSGYSLDESLSGLISGYEVVSVFYYDNYNFLDLTAGGDSLAYRAAEGYDTAYVCTAAPEVSARGLMTGTATRVLGTGTMLARSVYYDSRGNVIQTHEQNLLGGHEHWYYRLSFTGKPLTVKHVHTTADTINVEVMRYTYDSMERPLATYVSRDGGPERLLCGTAYDARGRVASRQLGPSAAGAVSYAYNVRGWTTGISSARFSQTVRYEDPGATGAAPCYNGNVCAVEWTQPEIPGLPPTSQRYAYSYDGLNRLTSAAYAAPGALGISGGWSLGQRRYSCTYSYDLNGNPTAITRDGVSTRARVFGYTDMNFGPIDDLSLEYEGNRLVRVTDQCGRLSYEGAMDFRDGADRSVEYAYDANGNMTRDLNRGIHRIAYNILNLPERIEWLDGHETRYTYAADGRKLRVQYLLNPYAIEEEASEEGEEAGEGEEGGEEPVNGGMPLLSLLGGGIDGTVHAPGGIVVDEPGELEPSVLMTRDYCGNHIYRNGVLERVLTDAGYVDSLGSHYFIADYRGDVRCVIDDAGTLEESTSYYPYGMPHGTGLVAKVQPYKYTGKELDRETGLDWYDSQARMYDPTLIVTTTMDPMAEKYYSISPYAWCGGNPLRYIDPKGQFLLENIPNEDCNYPLIAVFFSNRDAVLEKDYIAARDANVPIMIVDDMADDFASAMNLFSNMLGCSTDIYTINTHGSPGSMSIPPNREGTTSVNFASDFSLLKDGLNNKTVFIGACDVGKDFRGVLFTQSLSLQTGATVITSEQPLCAGYKYDGSHDLLPETYRFNNSYKISEKGGTFREIQDVRMDKDKGITWKENFFWTKPYNSNTKIPSIWQKY